MNTAQEKVRRCRTLMLIRQPFFGTLAASLNLAMTAGTPGGARTDGTAIHFDPRWVAQQSDTELTAVITEMVMHIVLKHHIRIRGKDPQRWNRAADQAVFHTLQRANVALRHGAYAQPEFQGLNAEQIYQRMAPQPQPQPPENESASDQCRAAPAASPQGGAANADPQPPDEGASPGEALEQFDLLCDTGGGAKELPTRQPGADEPGGVIELPSDVDSAVAEQNVRQLVMRAAKATRVKGKLPGDLDREIGELLRARTDWRSHLVHWMQQLSAADYSWRRPNPRFMPLGLYLPALRTEEMGAVVFAIDTSGSIGQEELDQAASEASALCAELNPRAIHVVYCDAKVQRVETYERGDALNFRPAGGGGTNFRPVFDWVEALDEPPAGVVYVTDGYGAFPTSAPEVPVLWLINSDVVAPFGDTVRTN